MNLRGMRIEDMSNLYPDFTGVESILYVSTKVSRHKPRVKVGKKGKDASVSIEDEPKILAGNLSEPLFKQVVKWIKSNKEVLLSYWNEEMDTSRLIYNLKKI